MATKNTINGVGALVVGGAFVLGGLVVAKPQFDAASNLRAETTTTREDRTNQELRLAQLKSEDENLPALKETLANAKREIPSQTEVDGLARVVVEQLGNVTLTSFSHFPKMPFTPLASPKVSLQPPESPTDKLRSDAAGEAEKPGTGPAVLQQVPIVIVVTARDNADIIRYMERLANGPRRILVQSVQSSSEGGEGTSATIYAYGFVNAPVSEGAPTATPTPAPTS